MIDVRDRYARLAWSRSWRSRASRSTSTAASAVEPTGRRGPGPRDRPGREALAPRTRRAPTPSSAATSSTPRSSTSWTAHRRARGGEIQLTDALQRPAIDGTVHGVVFDGLRYDTGDKADYLRTVVRLACDRDDLGPEFIDWLKGFVAEWESGEGAVRRRLAA